MLAHKSFYWKDLKSSVSKHIKQCLTCQKRNIQMVKYAPVHFSTLSLAMPFISMDLNDIFDSSSSGYHYDLMVICMLTGYTFCVPLKTKNTSEVVQSYIEKVYDKFGGSMKILSENGMEFKSQLFTNVATQMGVEHKVYSPPYHPQSNGRIEGLHNFCKVCMSKHVSKYLEWD